MSSSETSLGKSRILPGRYPPPGTDPVADAIRERRGARGITPLDANLLHVPDIASGYNALLGAIRTKGKLPGDVREAMILRIAALNHAAFEWIQHESIGRKEGLTTGQLYAIRDAETPLPPLTTMFTPLQAAAIAFTDYSTRNVRVPLDFAEKFTAMLRGWISSQKLTEVDPDDLYAEAAMVVASYNMVSRFLLSTDVADYGQHFIELPSFPPAPIPAHGISAVTLITSPSAPWIVFASSLLTDWSMWAYVVPYFLDRSCNILLHSQRGHGRSTLPPPTDGQDRLATIPLLASDIANLLEALKIPTPVDSVIGVSQGGATALAFANMYGDKTRSIVACDTAARTPAGNKDAWAVRIRLVRAVDGTSADEYAQRIGMGKLAKVTVPRWFPTGSICGSAGTPEGAARARWVDGMVERTDVEGFVHGARALSDYDVTPGLFESKVERILLLAGDLDGSGKVGQGLQALHSSWSVVNSAVEFVGIDNAGHLPMIDSPELFCEAVGGFLGGS
ncbi:hypothetical protein NLJ89_g9275 [Agrocybe chaxingu]|uniref:Uncharacterized protein n=1 Tax=Agrocybe chaxingu TaxID=84603 RepID=A0A9W8JTM3_9AGAR|nr:hypothetical protein NLJ89_g9275 [Agrocybe chaxingu]